MIVHRRISAGLQGNLLLWKRDGEMSVLDCGGFEQRHESVIRLLGRVEELYTVPDFPLLRVWTEDRPVQEGGDERWRVLSFSSRPGFGDVPVPDFLFDGWPSVGIDDYETAAAEVASAGERPAEHDVLGWVGNCETTPVRWDLHREGARHPDLLEVRHVVWVTREDGAAMATLGGNQLSLEQQVRRWAYLIDVEGRGWSARLKLLLHSGRPVFIQERTYAEWFFPQLVPMEHFIPVRGDLGDLIDRVRWAHEHPEQAQAIGRAGQAFARRALTRENALHRWAQTLGHFATKGPLGYGPPELRRMIDPLLAEVKAPLLDAPVPRAAGSRPVAADPPAQAVPRRPAVSSAAATLPTVSALVAAYNYEQYVGRAVQSALDQDYPADRLEVVVVDDGSTDATADVVRTLAERHPGRVRLIQQANAGYVAATSRAMAEARGELLALIDADDMWLAHKTRTQVAMLTDRPELGMVFADMVVVDGDDVVTAPSVNPALRRETEFGYARILRENVATQSSIMFRRELVEHLVPIPDGVPYADWWIALRSAQFSTVAQCPEPLALYRVHGANLTGSVTGAAAVREAHKDLAFQRHALIHLPLEAIGTAALEYVWEGVELKARKLIDASMTHFVEPLAVSEGERAQVDEVLAEADRRREQGDVDGEAALALRALALDPSRYGLRQRLAQAAARARAVAEAPDPLDGAEGLVLLADLEDLQRDETMLTAFADRLGGVAGVILAIDGSRLPVAQAGEQLRAQVARAGLGDRDDLRMLAIVGARDEAQHLRMLRRAHAHYRPRADVGGPLPVYTPQTLGALRDLVGGRLAA